MDIKNLQDAMKLQQELTRKLTQHIETLRKEKAPPLEALLKEKEQSLARLRADVEDTIKERELALNRWDQRIDQRKAALATLEKELADLKKQVPRGDLKPDTAPRKKRTRKK